MRLKITGVVVAALAAVTVVLPAAQAGATTTASAPDPCATPMVFTGMDGNFTQHLFYRAGCSSPAAPLDGVNYVISRPVLTPDGRSVVAVGDPDTSASQYEGLEITDIATGTTTAVAQAGTPATVNKVGLSVAPDSSAIAYLGSSSDSDERGVWVQKLDGSPAYRVAAGAGVDDGLFSGSTAWSHDGRYIAYPFVTSDGRGTITESIAYSPADGSGGQTLIPVAAANHIRSLAWTPDDRGLLYYDEADYFGTPPTGHLLYADLATGAVTTVLIGEPGFTFASVAVDQHWTVFVTSTNQNTPVQGAHTHRMDAAWLGDPGSVRTLPNVALDPEGGNIPLYDSWNPSVATAAGGPGAAGVPGGRDGTHANPNANPHANPHANPDTHADANPRANPGAAGELPWWRARQGPDAVRAARLARHPGQRHRGQRQRDPDVRDRRREPGASARVAVGVPADRLPGGPHPRRGGRLGQRPVRDQCQHRSHHAVQAAGCLHQALPAQLRGDGRLQPGPAGGTGSVRHASARPAAARGVPDRVR